MSVLSRWRWRATSLRRKGSVFAVCHHLWWANIGTDRTARRLSIPTNTIGIASHHLFVWIICFGLISREQSKTLQFVGDFSCALKHNWLSIASQPHHWWPPLQQIPSPLHSLSLSHCARNNGFTGSEISLLKWIPVWLKINPKKPL